MTQNKVVFFSWQSDMKAAATRTLIERALELAVKQIGAEELRLEEAERDDEDPQLVVDSDTQGVPGAVNIRDTIFEKIDAATVFVADVTILGKVGPKQKPTPNPNVLVELSRAVTTLGWNRVIMVMNTAYGDVADLPFDLRGHKVLSYESSPEDVPDRVKERRKLVAELQGAIVPILRSAAVKPKRYPAELKLSYRKDEHSTGERHNYLLDVSLTNKGESSVSNWHFDVFIPKALMRPEITMHAREVRTGGTDTHALFRFEPSDSAHNKNALHPGDTETRSIPYHFTDQLFWSESLVAELITAKAWMNDALVAEEQLTFDEWQNF